MWADHVRKYAKKLDPIGNGTLCDVLDYGCGKQLLAASCPELKIRGYDPAFPELAALAEPADLVMCTDVLEHIEPELLDNVFADLKRVTKKYGFFVIATRPAKKILADGRNAHLIQESMEWWLLKLSRYFDAVYVYNKKNNDFHVLVCQKRPHPIAIARRAEKQKALAEKSAQ